MSWILTSTSGAKASLPGSSRVVRTVFSSREVITTLTKHGFVPVGGKGSHTTLRYENPDTNEVRTVTVPQGGSIPVGTLQDIADQAGAEDFHEFYKWVERSS